MAQLVEVKVPDIGDFKDVAVIEVMVKVGETIAVDTGLVMVESDKASMEIPSTHAGVIKEIKVKVNDKVSEGSVLLVVEAAGAASSPPPLGEGRVGASASAQTALAAQVGGPPEGEGANTPARPTSNAKCWSSAQALAATPRPSAAPTSA
jgi:dihydrolipoamide dehydrogenase